MRNHGLILEQVPYGIGYVGGIAPDLPVLLPSGDWRPYLPEFERQAKHGLETMNCVQFSRLNVSEIQANFHGKPLNLSDRFLYWASGCTERGNTFSNCDYGIRQHGTPPEALWPWATPLTRAEYGKEPPKDVQDEAKKLHDEWDVGMLVWVPRTLPAMREALTKGPLWFCNSYHAMVITAITDRFEVYDTYGDGYGSFPLDYLPEIQAVFLAPFSPKKPDDNDMKFIENTLYQVVEGKGGFMLYAAGKLYYDDTAKILASWAVRNGGKTEGKVGVLRLQDFDDAPLSNLKGESVTF